MTHCIDIKKIRTVKLGYNDHGYNEQILAVP
jgi:hypothetical protein